MIVTYAKRRLLMGGSLCLALSLGAGASLAQESGGQTPADVVKIGLDGGMSRDLSLVEWMGANDSPPPVKGATVAVMPCPLELETCQFELKSAKEAAAAMGWEVFPIDNKGDPAVAQKGVDAAISRGVSCVLSIASPARDIRTQIKRGKEKGIAFVTAFSDDPRPYGGDVALGINFEGAGKLLAAYVIANGGGNVVVFDAPQLPQLTARQKGFIDYVKEHGGETTKVIQQEEFSLSQGSPGLITKMQALLTRHPAGEIDWIITPYIESLVPLAETAKQRGRNEIKAVSYDGGSIAYNYIRTDGPLKAVLDWGLEWIAWAGIDECNRALNNAPTGVNTDFPIRITDASNVPPVGEMFQLGYDFKAQYKKMWDEARK